MKDRWTILARVYLTEKDWTSAKPLLEDVINAGHYERFVNGADIWDDSNDNGKEFVFEIQFISGNIGEGNDFPDDVIPTDMSSEEVPYGGSNGHMFSSKNIYNAFEEGDIRRDLTLKKGYTTIDENVNTGTIWVNKFCHGKVTAIADWEINWPVLNISDVYLMYAEVLNEINYSSGGDAMEILNWNRNRAGLALLVASDVPDQDSFRSAIEKERRLEFAFENIRWFDLVRTDRAYDVINDFLEADTYPAGNDYELESYQLIFAIPQEELYRNPDENYMWQNPGY